MNLKYLILTAFIITFVSVEVSASAVQTLRPRAGNLPQAVQPQQLVQGQQGAQVQQQPQGQVQQPQFQGQQGLAPPQQRVQAPIMQPGIPGQLTIEQAITNFKIFKTAHPNDSRFDIELNILLMANNIRINAIKYLQSAENEIKQLTSSATSQSHEAIEDQNEAALLREQQAVIMKLQQLNDQLEQQNNPAQTNMSQQSGIAGQFGVQLQQPQQFSGQGQARSMQPPSIIPQVGGINPGGSQQRGQTGRQILGGLAGTARR